MVDMNSWYEVVALDAEGNVDSLCDSDTEDTARKDADKWLEQRQEDDSTLADAIAIEVRHTKRTLIVRFDLGPKEYMFSAEDEKAGV